jgi:hypothetical protein
MTRRKLRRFPIETMHAGYVLITLVIFATLALGSYEAVAAYVNPEASILFPPTAPEEEPLPDRWLTMEQPTQIYTPDDQKAWVAQPGDIFQVILEQDDWMLVLREGDPPSNLMWMHREPWLTLVEGNPLPPS